MAWFKSDIKDHPRSRGVYAATTSTSESSGGSSPLARGLPTLDVDALQFVGIIPARAGFTTREPPSPSGSWDHPRSRGVYAIMENNLGAQNGSSPLARGLLGRHNIDVAMARIIPARAGFTQLSEVVGALITDHPRSRGVYRRIFASSPVEAGSSPLARGLQRMSSGDYGVDRIIPARAGFTFAYQSGQIHTWDHPRSRGVYSGRALVGIFTAGSSPLARGLRG